MNDGCISRIIKILLLELIICPTDENKFSVPQSRANLYTHPQCERQLMEVMRVRKNEIFLAP